MPDPTYPTEPYVAHLVGGAFLVVKATPRGVEIGEGAGDDRPADVPTKPLAGTQQIHNLLAGTQLAHEEAVLRYGAV